MRLYNPKCLWILFLLLFSTHSLCYLLDVRPCCIIINFLILSSVCLYSFFVYFKNGSEYLTSRTAQVFIPLMRFLQQNLVSRSFLVLLRYTLLIHFFLRLCLFDYICFPYSQVLVASLPPPLSLSLSASKCILDLVVLFISLLFFSYFSLSAWHILQCRIPFLYPGCIVLFLYQSSVLFHFMQM